MSIPCVFYWLDPSEIVNTEPLDVGGRTILLDPSRRFASIASLRGKVARQNYQDANHSKHPTAAQLVLIQNRKAGYKLYNTTIQKKNPNWGIRRSSGQGKESDLRSWQLKLSIAGAHQLHKSLF